MNNLTTAQWAYDNMLPEDIFPEMPDHRFTGYIVVDDVGFTFDDGAIMTVSYYDADDNFCEVPFVAWVDDNNLVEKADAEAEQEWLREALK